MDGNWRCLSLSKNVCILLQIVPELHNTKIFCVIHGDILPTSISTNGWLITPYSSTLIMAVRFVQNEKSEPQIFA